MIPQPVDTYLEYYAGVDGAPNKVFPAPALVPVGTPYGGPMAELVVHLDGEPTTDFIHNPEGTITFPQSLPEGTRVQIWRYTDVSQGVVVFPNPTLYSPRDANKAVTQVLLGVQELWGRLLELWRYAKWLKVFLEDLIQELKEYTDGKIQYWVSDTAEQLQSLKNYIDQKASDLTSHINQSALGLVDYINQKVSTLASLISEELDALGDSVDQRFSTLETYANNKFTALGTKIDQDITGLRQWASEEIQSIHTIMGNRVTEIWDYLYAQLPQFPVLVEEKVGELKDYVDEKYSDVVNTTIPAMEQSLSGQIYALRGDVYNNDLRLNTLANYVDEQFQLLGDVSGLKDYIDSQIQSLVQTHTGTWSEGELFVDVPFEVTRGLLFLGGVTYDLSRDDQGVTLTPQEDSVTRVTLNIAPVVDLMFTLVVFF